MLRVVVGSLLLCVLASAPGLAQSETPDDVDEAARILFQSGSAAYAEGRFEEALDRFEQAYALSPRPQLLYNIASCNDRLDRRAIAVDYYERFLQELPESERASLAQARLDVLRRSLADDARQDDELQQDPVVEAPEPTEPPPPPERSLVGPIALFAVAGAGLATVAVAGGLALGRRSDASAECDAGACDEDALDAVDRAALVADIGLGVAVLAAAAGLVWFLVSRPDGDGARAWLTPAVSPQAAGLRVGGRF